MITCAWELSSAASKQFLEHIGFDKDCFNAEFIWGEENDKLWVVEFNTRISQSHSEMFIMVDGMSNHDVAIDIALGQRPSMPNRSGAFPVAAKCLVPHDHEEAIVKYVPSQHELDELKERFPGTQIRLDIELGIRLSELRNHDSLRITSRRSFSVPTAMRRCGNAIMNMWRRCSSSSILSSCRLRHDYKAVIYVNT